MDMKDILLVENMDMKDILLVENMDMKDIFLVENMDMKDILVVVVVENILDMDDILDIPFPHLHILRHRHRHSRPLHSCSHRSRRTGLRCHARSPGGQRERGGRPPPQAAPSSSLR